MGYTIIGDTRRNTHWPDKPNEDLFWFDQSLGAAMVLDGVSRDRENGVYPNPSPSRDVTERFARAAQAVLTAPGWKDPRQKLSEAVLAGNEAVAQANVCFPSDFLPGTVGVLALIKDSQLHYAFVGDCLGMVLSPGGVSVFTQCQTKAIHDRPGQFSAHEIRCHICNNAQHPCGYGVWTGQPGAMDFLRLGAMPLNPGDRVLLCSDGVEPFLSAAGWEALRVIDSQSMLRKAMSFQKPTGWMDDRTAVIITVDE